MGESLFASFSSGKEDLPSLVRAPVAEPVPKPLMRAKPLVHQRHTEG
jgi:hypothetical protein